ncbi:MAG: hypothetical protein KBB91_00690 [Candidatus Pacebacteria bacterium]|jgi:hypothetical protein|nr:hypothetical protein [Candidatus Paceibacterota bacterium]MBP9700923.1 hypothetical protein [Candidatus Paceibacterota bacterium]
MKKHTITSALIVFGFLIGLATISGASVTNFTTYQNPVAGPTEDSKEAVPITIGSIDQVKDAALTLQSTFEARGNAWFRGNTYIKGFVAGANPNVLGSVISFGGTGNTVSVDATGSATIDEDFQTASLATGGEVCADINGTLKICPPDISPECQPGYVLINGQCVLDTTCAANLAFVGNARWGRVTYTGLSPAHPAFTVTVTLIGKATPEVATGIERNITYTMPSNSTISYDDTGQSCGTGIGCEVNDPFGFYDGYVSAVTPVMMPGGRVCVEQHP